MREEAMRSSFLILVKAVGFGLGTLGLFTLATHAASPAPQKASKCPWVIAGRFDYHEQVKSGDFQDTNEIVVAYLEVGLVQCDPYDQMAVYTLDRLEFTAKGNALEEKVYNNGDHDCLYKRETMRSGGGTIDPADPVSGLPQTATGAPIAFASALTSLTWFRKDNRFSMHFQVPRDKGHVVIRTTDPCARDPVEPIIDDYLWTCDLSGVVGYNAKTKTYKFVLLDEYEVPYRDDPGNYTCTVKVSGELTASQAAWKTRK